jgi:hypothetical protein
MVDENYPNGQYKSDLYFSNTLKRASEAARDANHTRRDWCFTRLAPAVSPDRTPRIIVDNVCNNSTSDIRHCSIPPRRSRFPITQSQSALKKESGGR